MTDLKFKLKKGGKGVGYMRVRRDHDRLIHEYRRFRDSDWVPRNIMGELLYEADSIHPFVCQDPNGLEVYEGDAIRDTSLNSNGTVIWREDSLDFALQMDTGLHECITRKYIEFIDPAETGGKE